MGNLKEIITKIIGRENNKVDELPSVQILEGMTIRGYQKLGFTKIQAEKITAAFDAIRLYEQHKFEKKIAEVVCIRETEDAVHYFADIRFLPQEHFKVIFLDDTNHCVGHETLFIGTSSQASVGIKEVINRMLQYKVTRVIVGHNHPSLVSAHPSPEDVELTYRMDKAFQLINFDLVDHIIVAGELHCSMKEKGYF